MSYTHTSKSIIIFIITIVYEILLVPLKLKHIHITGLLQRPPEFFTLHILL